MANPRGSKAAGGNPLGGPSASPLVSSERLVARSENFGGRSETLREATGAKGGLSGLKVGIGAEGCGDPAATSRAQRGVAGDVTRLDRVALATSVVRSGGLGNRTEKDSGESAGVGSGGGLGNRSGSGSGEGARGGVGVGSGGGLGNTSPGVGTGMGRGSAGGGAGSGVRSCARGGLGPGLGTILGGRSGTGVGASRELGREVVRDLVGIQSGVLRDFLLRFLLLSKTPEEVRESSREM